MYVSYTCELDGRGSQAVRSPCTSEADARTRTGDPFITRQAADRDASPRQTTRGPAVAAIADRTAARARCPEWTRETPVVYGFYTPALIDEVAAE
jgi:hypothetical protein